MLEHFIRVYVDFLTPPRLSRVFCLFHIESGGLGIPPKAVYQFTPNNCKAPEKLKQSSIHP